MFALIETKGATHIAVCIPRENADKSIPAIVGLFEDNTKFIQKGFSELSVCKPNITIVLGQVLTFENYQNEMVVTIPDSNTVFEGYYPLTPEVLLSNKKAIEAKDQEIKRLRAELTLTENRLARAKDELASAGLTTGILAN
jgi:hypothetical protein